MKKNQRIYLFNYLDSIVNRENNAGKVGNAETYQTVRNVLYSFFVEKQQSKKTDFELSFIDAKQLALFIEDCQSRNLKPNSIGNYLRTLRAVYNRAIKEEGYNYYPFKDFNWKPFKNKTRKKAISKTDINRIIKFKVEPGTDLYNARQFFAFMYMCYGLNFRDMAKLESENIVKVGNDYVLVYDRSKGGKHYENPLSTEALEIIKYYRNLSEGKYIFPILNEDIHITPEQIRTRCKTALKKINSDIRDIAKELEIDENISSYVTRHTLASVLSKSGVNIQTISEMLGHSDLKTTQIYLKEIDLTDKIEAAKNLLD